MKVSSIFQMDQFMQNILLIIIIHHMHFCHLNIYPLIHQFMYYSQCFKYSYKHFSLENIIIKV